MKTAGNDKVAVEKRKITGNNKDGGEKQMAERNKNGGEKIKTEL